MQITLSGMCFDARRHPDKDGVLVCPACLRELIGRLDELERRVAVLDTPASGASATRA